MAREVKKMNGSYYSVGKSHAAGPSGIIRHSKWENRNKKTIQHEQNKVNKALNHSAISRESRHEERNVLRLK